VFATDELALAAGPGWFSSLPIGRLYFSAEAVQYRVTWTRGSVTSKEWRRAEFERLGPFALACAPGGRDELRDLIDPELADLVDFLQPVDPPSVLARRAEWELAGAKIGSTGLWIRIDDGAGRFAGFCSLVKPAPGMSHLAAASATADLTHLERMQTVADADRRSAAILMADLEASSPLARRLSTAQYFAFTRRLVRAADRCIIDSGGIVGRHAGDGVMAFFLVETAGSESAAAKSCIVAARSLRGVLADVARRSNLSGTDVSLRFGLHWGGMLYVGRILTGGRSEVTALGDEMNETARIEACATGGRTLASKSLIERLDNTDADTLDLATRERTYTLLAELPTATEKARRDAPSIAVCEV
jgi:class 3 adenylate cyclase